MRKFPIAWGPALLAAATVLATRDLQAGGTIDTSGATLSPGSATAPGQVTIDSSADLGAVPPITDVDIDQGVDEEFLAEFQGQVLDMSDWGHKFGGLGGPDFHARADVTLSAREHNFGAFTVDDGVTVTIASGTTVHVAGDARVDGRILFADAGNHVLDCGGDLTVVGHAGTVAGGFATDDGSASPNSYNVVNVPGRLSVTADSGARVRLDSGFTVYGRAAATIAHADADRISLNSTVDVTFTDCAGTQLDMGTEKDASVDIAGTTFGQANLFVGGAVTLTDVTIASLSVTAPTGSVTIAGTSSIGTTTATYPGWFHVEALGDVVVEDGCAVSPPRFEVWSYAGLVELGTGVQVDTRGLYASPDAASRLQPYGHGGVEIRGFLRCDGGIDVAAGDGDIVLGNGAELTSGAEVWLRAQGAVTASGGTVDITASDLDVRCVDGDLDLDVASVTVGDGQVVVLSNGQVQLRGSFSAAHDVQILSRKDAIDVSGATISTADAGASLSGLVRLATYASTATIDASDATLTTGSSDGQSGDILLQIAESGGAMTSGALQVAAVTTRESADGPVTMVRGTVKSKGRNVDFAGSNRVAAGALRQHVYLNGKHGKLRGKAGGVDLQVTRRSAKSATFVMTLHDGGGAAGEVVPLALERAGFHATGKFRRPRAKH